MTILRKLKTSTIVATLLLAPTFALAANAPGSAALVDVARTMAADDARIVASLDKTFGARLPADKLEIAKSNLKSLLSEPDLSAKLAEMESGLDGAALSAAQKDEIVMEGITQMRAKGMTRLSPDQMATLVTYTRGFMSALPPELCARMADKQISTTQMNYVEARYMATLPIGTFREVQALTRASILAELNDYPRKPVLTPVQLKAADAAFEVSFDKAAEAFRKGKATVSESDVTPCAVGVVSIDAVLAMKDPYRGWELIKMLQNQ